MIHFVGTSFAAVTLKEGARRRGLTLTDDINEAKLIFISEDTPTSAQGVRNLEPIRKLLEPARGKPIVLTSQVPPGFCRSLGIFGLYHQAETLRIEDGLQRAMYPEMFIVGVENTSSSLAIHSEYRKYLDAFECPVLKMTYEEAELTKIAINMTLVAQVNSANMLAHVAKKVGADWGVIANALRHDSRIGKYSYLSPGSWGASKHLLRDFVTVQEILK